MKILTMPTVFPYLPANDELYRFFIFQVFPKIKPRHFYNYNFSAAPPNSNYNFPARHNHYNGRGPPKRRILLIDWTASPRSKFNKDFIENCRNTYEKPAVPPRALVAHKLFHQPWSPRCALAGCAGDRRESNPRCCLSHRTGLKSVS